MAFLDRGGTPMECPPQNRMRPGGGAPFLRLKVNSVKKQKFWILRLVYQTLDRYNVQDYSTSQNDLPS